jgi:hypothetical protein
MDNMNLEKILAENLVRFKVKNLNYDVFEKKFVRLLKEQDESELAYINIERMKTNGELYNLFKKWEQSIAEDATAVKLVKTSSYVPKTNTPIIVRDEFYNNFVTLEKGVKNPAAIKKSLDLAIEQLKQQGVNLEDPKTEIEIVSTATELPAGVGPVPNDYAGGKVPAVNMRLDHDYGGQLKYDKTGKPTQESREWARSDNNGNKYLALKRGESAKAYLESKGVKTPIRIITKIVPKEQKREFQITAVVKGNEKVINPIGTPKVQWSCGATANIYISNASTTEDFETGGITGKKNSNDAYNYYNKMYNDWQADNRYARMQGGTSDPMPKELAAWQAYGNSYNVFIEISGGATIDQARAQLQKAVFQLTPTLADTLEKTFTNKTNTFTGTSAKLKFAGERGENQTLMMSVGAGGDPKAQSAELAKRGVGTVEAGGIVASYLESTGQVLNGGMILNGLLMVGSPLQTALTGQDFIGWLKQICASLPKTNPTEKAANAPDQQKINDAWEQIEKKTFKSSGAGDFKQLISGAIQAGIPGVAATPQKDPAYWKNAYFFDATTGNNPPQEGKDYGKLNAKTAPIFFQGAELE